MTETATEFVSTMEGDAAGFVEIVRTLAMGVVREQQPKRLYVIRIDNWFGPKWLNFSGKFSVASGAGFGVHKTRLHVPPFVPARVISERVFATSELTEIDHVTPLHIDCSSKTALSRRIEDVDKTAVFIWFSSESVSQQRGAVMVYLPVVSNESGFYVGFAEQEGRWHPSMLRGISRGELNGLLSSRVQAGVLP